MMRIILSLIVAVGIGQAATASANPHLSTVKPINDGLLAVGIADEIRKKCPSISARLFRALRYMDQLENHAKSMGYSDAEIEAYVTDPEAKAAMRARGEAYLAANGVDLSQPESYCALGRAEIANSSAIGVLLRAK